MTQIYDTTLRDGAQAEGITFSIDDKIKIVNLLDDLGVSWIEAGNPGANPKDEQFFRIMKSMPGLRHAGLAAFGSTIKPNTQAADDEALQKLSNAFSAVKVIFGKSWSFHVDHILHCTKEENLRIIYDSVHFLKKQGNTVWFDAEHFFDGYMEDREYAFMTIRSAIEAGASRITLCDTNGATLPENIANIVKDVRDVFDVPVAIHCHNDCGLATACSLAAVRSGCDMIQGTIGGIGERCGNADLCTIIPLLEIRLNDHCIPMDNLQKITDTYHTAAEIMNIVPSGNAPFVGRSAFSHKGGMHIDAVMKATSAYEQIRPEDVGNQRRFLVSDQTGRAGVYAKLGKVLPDLTPDSDKMRLVISRLKEREAEGYTYENADGSFALLALDTLGRRPRYYEVVDYHVLCSSAGNNNPQETRPAQAYLKVNVNGKNAINAAEGEGPVNALDIALRKTLSEFYPCLNEMKLKDFKVRVLNSEGTASKVRVSIESAFASSIWNTVGVSEDIITACMIALIDSVDYMLTYFSAEN